MPNTISKHLVFNLEEIKQEDCLTLLIISDFFVIIYVLISTSEQGERVCVCVCACVCVNVGVYECTCMYVCTSV